MPARTRPTTVLFDLDGTLIDSIELILNSARHAFRAWPGHVPTDAEWLTGVGIPLDTMFRRYASTDAEVAQLTIGYREYQTAHHDRLVRAYDGAVETLATLHAQGHPIGIVTSKGGPLAQRGLEHVGLMQYVDTIVGCDICDRHKPDPEPVMRALALLGAAPGDAVFVGDSEHDMLAGNAAGVITIAALWGPFTRAELAPAHPAYYLDHLADLPPLLARLAAE